MPSLPLKEHLDLVEVPASCSQPVDTLVVLLPGAYDTVADFQKHGFPDAMRRHHIAADLVMAEAHVGYYGNRSVVDRLQQDVIEPARAKGYRSIWLAGISIGGFGSLLYAKNHGRDIAGMYVMAPFLGNRTMIAEIDRAGGLAAWQPGAITPDDYERDMWTWLKGYAGSPAQGKSYPPLYIGYGEDDRFAGSNAMLARSLSRGHAWTTDGGHQWAPWERLWNDFLGRNILPKCAQPKAPA